MRLVPVHKPSTLLVRVAFWISRRRLGKVMSPLKVVYNRFPELLLANRRLIALMENDTIEQDLRAMISTWVSTLNGCGFCTDLHRAEALRSRHVDHDLLANLATWESHPGFSARHRAALAYAEQITLYKEVEDDVFDRLKPHFDERQIVFLTWFVAATNYLNLMARPLQIESDGFCQLALKSDVSSAQTSTAPTP